jgi:large subunit ribosomal protein L16
MLMPKRIKYRKSQRRRIRGKATRGHRVEFGDYGLQAMEQGWISARQIEAGRITASHFLRGEGKVWIRIFPHKPVSGKPLETRMGKGKGDTDFWAAVVKPGTVLYEVGGLPEDVARQVLNRMSHKMPIRCRLARRNQKL